MPFFRRIFLTRTSFMLALLLIALGSIAIGLTESPRLNDIVALPWLFTAAALGALLGWLLGASRLPGWVAMSVGAATGMGWALVEGGRLAWPLLNWLNKVPPLLPQILRWRETPPDWQPALTAWQLLSNQSALAWLRLLRWGDAIVEHTSISDPLPLAIFWILVLWLLAFWAGWATRRLHHPLLALTPATALLAAVLNYQGLDHYSLIAPLGATMFLMAFMRYHHRESDWLKNRIDFVEDIPTDLTIATGAVVIILLIAGFFMPSFSVKAITEFVRGYFQPASQSMEALGLQARPQPAVPSASRPAGLLRYHHLGAGPNLTQEIVMLVDVLEPAYSPPPYASAVVNGAPRYYWRATTYDRYDGAGWSSRSTKKVKYTAEQPIFSDLPVFQEMIRQRVTPVRPLGGVLLATGALQSANAPYQIDWRATPGSFTDADQFGALIADGPYEAVSLLPNVSAGQLRATSTDYPDWVLQYYLQLPDNLPFRVRELAIEITANQDNPYDKAKAIEGFLRTIPYSLDTPAPPRGVDVVDHFLFTLQTGFCDHYASSMVVLARSAGLPARMVIGFASGNYNPEKHQYVVREANSHAWAEVFFTGIGWVEFEPTANQTAIIRAEDSQRSLPIPAIELPAVEPQPVISLAERLKGYAILALPGLLCLAALSVQAFFMIRSIEMWWWSRKPPRQAIRAVYERMRRYARRTFGFIPGGDTPDEFAAHLQSLLLATSQGLPLRKQFEKRFAPAGDEIRQLTHLYTYAAYSDHPITPDGRKAALHAWRKLRGRLWLARLLQKGTKRQ